MKALLVTIQTEVQSIFAGESAYLGIIHKKIKVRVSLCPMLANPENASLSPGYTTRQWLITIDRID